MIAKNNNFFFASIHNANSWNFSPSFFQIVGALGGPEDWVPTLWRSHGSVNQKLGRLIPENVLPLVNTRVIMALDRVDAVWSLPFKDDCFGMLRPWAQDPRLAKLRFILGISTTPQRLIDRPTQSPFNLTPPIVLADFNRAQIEQLAGLYGLTWSDQRLHHPHRTLRRSPLPRAPRDAPRQPGRRHRRQRVLDEGTSLFDDFLLPSPDVQDEACQFSFARAGCDKGIRRR